MWLPMLVQCVTATEKSQIGLHVGFVSFTLTFASRCFCSLRGYCLYIMAFLGEPFPSAWMLNQSAFVQGNIRTLFHLWMAARKKKLTPPLPEAGHSRWYLQNLRPFYFTSSSPPPLCAIKETSIQTPIRLFWDFSLPSSGLPAFRIKSYSLPQHLVSNLLACRVASGVSLDSVTLLAVWLWQVT